MRKEDTCLKPKTVTHSHHAHRKLSMWAKTKKKVRMKADLYPRSTSAPPLLLALLARGSTGLGTSSAPSVSPTSGASLSSARSDSKVTRATANCSSRPLHLLPGILSTPQACNSRAGCSKKVKNEKNKNEKKNTSQTPRPADLCSLQSKLQEGKRGEKEEKTIKTK